MKKLNSEEKELMIEVIADMKALAVTTAFLTQSVLEVMGMRPETLIKTVEAINLKSGDLFENAMRSRLGMEPRTEPRQSVLSRLEELQELRSIDWSKLDEH